jgi:hypothetical protein
MRNIAWWVCLGILAAVLVARPAAAASWYVAPSGTPDGAGTQDSPWDLASALGGKQKIAPGDTIWIAAGTYKHPNRKLGSPGYEVRLAGQEGKPIHVRGASGQRVTIDGGLTVVTPSTHVWIWNLEILVSENFTMPRTVRESGSHPGDYGRPWGGLNVHAGAGSKYINLVIHDNAQGVSFWSGATDSELHGCILYDNGWKAPDRGHGHAIYTQNQNGVKTISDCIMTGGYSYTMHAYGSSRAYVDNYLIQGNVAYDAGPFLVGGGRPSRGIRVLDNYLYHVPMHIGYSAPYNEDCQVCGNVIVGAGLSINKFKQVVDKDNLVLGKEAPRPKQPAQVIVRPNQYDPRRAHVIVLNWARQPSVEILPTALLRPGDRYRLLDPRNVYGQPVATGTFDGKPIRMAAPGEFAVWILLKGD